MDRRTFITGSLGTAAAFALTNPSLAARVTPAGSRATAALPTLELTLTDTGFAFPRPLEAGRYQVTVSNAGTSAESHTAIGKIPDRVTDAQYDEWLESLQRTDGHDGETEAMSWDDIEFVGMPDWAPPGGKVTGVVDLAPGRYFLFDPFGQRGYLRLMVDGVFVAGQEPAADVTVTLKEMEIVLPETAFTSVPVRWKITNAGAMSHEVAIVPVSPEFTDEHLQRLFELPDDATPPPDIPAFDYRPVAAIGILAGQHTSWLDVRLPPGRYLAACMAPFGTGYPHAMDGMYRFFEVG